MVFQTWAALEERATALSIPRLTVADLEQARVANGRLAERAGQHDLIGFRAAAAVFHGVLSSRCPNRRLLAWARREALVSSTPDDRLRPPQWWAAAVATVQEHEVLLDLLREGGAPAAIDALLREHRAHITALALLEDDLDDIRDASLEPAS
jgi:DNA-binding GntR family transcriptional regulator